MEQKRTRKTLKFNRSDIAKAAGGVKVEAVYRAVERGSLDVDDLYSIAKYIFTSELEELKTMLKGNVPKRYKHIIKKIELKRIG